MKYKKFSKFSTECLGVLSASFHGEAKCTGLVLVPTCILTTLKEGRSQKTHTPKIYNRRNTQKCLGLAQCTFPVCGAIFSDHHGQTHFPLNLINQCRQKQHCCNFSKQIPPLGRHLAWKFQPKHLKFGRVINSWKQGLISVRQSPLPALLPALLQHSHWREAKAKIKKIIIIY